MTQGLLRHLAALLLFVICLLGIATAKEEFALPPDGAIIDSVAVEGLERLLPNDVLLAMEMREGTAFSAAAYRRDLQAITNVGTIDPIALRILWEDVSPGRIRLRVLLRENPIIESIQVVGNVRFSRTEILVQLGYEVGDIARTGLRSSTERNLRSFYREGGFKSPRIRVRPEPTNSEARGVEVLITIDEGKRIRIRSLKLEGNRYFSGVFLQTKLTNTRGILFFSNYFDEELLDDDIAQLQTMYREAGFLDATVRRGPFDYDEIKQDVVIRLRVEEGPRYRISSVVSEGVASFTPKEVARLTDRLPGRTFNGRRLDKAVTALRDLYGDQGYIDTTVGYRLEKETDVRRVKVILTAEEAPLVRVGAVRLQQEDYDYSVDLKPIEKFINWFVPATKPETVYREVRLRSGDKYRLSKEVRTKERIRNLGLFRKVEIERVPTEDPQVRDAVIKLDEDPAAAFLGVTAGVGEFSGPSITFSVVQPNIGGRGNRLRASATFGTQTQSYRLGYYQRYLGESDYSLDSNVYSSRDGYRAYVQRTLGGDTELGRPLNEYLFAYLQLRAERVDFTQYQQKAREDLTGYGVGTVRPTVVYDRRDAVRMAQRGYLVSGGFETGAADGFLFKALHAFENYHRFDRTDLVYAYQHTVGVMPYNATDIGLGERFFVGGSGNLRGFRHREVGPRDPGDKDLAIGGSTRITQRHELRYPIAEFLTIRGFTDAAILELGPAELGRPRIGSGVGFIVDFGPFVAEVDFGVAVLRRQSDRLQFFSLRLASDF